MASTTIASFFTLNNIPKIGLNPTIRIWEVDPSGNNTLIIGATEGTGDPGTGIGTDGIMIEMFDKSPALMGDGGLPIGGSRDGFYTFTFTSVMGYNPNKTYLIRTDGGNTLPNGERYHTSAIDSQVDVVNAILDEPAVAHTLGGSIGSLLNQTHANTQNLMLSVVDLTSLLNLLLKYETNRTRIDSVNQTLTVYDDDCTTPLRTFKLLDSFGVPSIHDVCERRPQSIGTSDGHSTCA